MRIDLTEVRNVLAAVDKMLSKHHGKDVHNSSVHPIAKPATIRLSGAAAAELADDLLMVQDYLRLADAEISALYWMSKGRDDPRRPTAGGIAAAGAGIRRPGPIAPTRANSDTNSRCGTSPSFPPVSIAR